MSRRTVLITGASSGIGAAFAEVFASEGFDLVLTAKREDRLQVAAERLRRRHGRHVDVVVADRSEVEAPSRICGEIARRGLTIDALVNSAGYGVPGSRGASVRREGHARPRAAATTGVAVERRGRGRSGGLRSGHVGDYRCTCRAASIG